MQSLRAGSHWWLAGRLIVIGFKELRHIQVCKTDLIGRQFSLTRWLARQKSIRNSCVQKARQAKKQKSTSQSKFILGHEKVVLFPLKSILCFYVHACLLVCMCVRTHTHVCMHTLMCVNAYVLGFAYFVLLCLRY